MQGFQDVIDPAKNILIKMSDFISYILVALLILLFGWLIAKFISNLVTKAFKQIKVDSFAEKSGIAEILVKGEIKHTASELLGSLVYWILMLVVLMIIASVLQLTQLAGLLDKIVSCIPDVIIAVAVLIIGIMLSNFVKGLVLTSAKNTGIASARGLATLAQAVVVIFAVLIALEQLGIGAILMSCVTIIIASLGLALGLAFGLGGKDIAAKILSDVREKYFKK